MFAPSTHASEKFRSKDVATQAILRAMLGGAHRFASGTSNCHSNGLALGGEDLLYSGMSNWVKRRTNVISRPVLSELRSNSKHFNFGLLTSFYYHQFVAILYNHHSCVHCRTLSYVHVCMVVDYLHYLYIYSASIISGMGLLG